MAYISGGGSDPDAARMCMTYVTDYRLNPVLGVPER